MTKHAVLLALLISLADCASPIGVPGVPHDAHGRWEAYVGYSTFEWQRRLQSGCASWVVTKLDTAVDGGAEVNLSTDPANCEDGPGVSYDTDADYLVFKNYWPWPMDQSFVIFDQHGNGAGYRPCPHTLSPEQIAQMRAVAQEANTGATTDAERRTLRRVDQLLAATDGAALASGQFGCTDLPTSIDAGVDRREDTWRGNQRPIPPAR